MELKTYDRQIAIKTPIQTLLLGDYIREKEQEPNYLLTKEQEKIYRINLMGVVLTKELQGSITNILLDDGTGKIVLRYFEENKILTQLNIGDALLVIGKLRSYNQEKYISPEIVKKIDHLWLKLRALEFKKKNKNNLNNQNKFPTNEKEEKQNKSALKSNKKISEESIGEKTDILPMQKLINLIKELDRGEGVLIEDIIANSYLTNTENLLEKMLEKGDIFQNSPGKVKVL